PAASSQPRRKCDIGEVHGATRARVLAIERHHQVSTVKIAVYRRIGDRNNIQLAVVIAIEQSDTTAHHFHQILLHRSGVRHGAEASLWADIAKAQPRRTRTLRRSDA